MQEKILNWFVGYLSVNVSFYCSSLPLTAGTPGETGLFTSPPTLISSISLHPSLTSSAPVWVFLLHSGLIYLFCPSQCCSLPLHPAVCIIFSISSQDAPLELSDLWSAEVWDVRWEVRPVTLPVSSLPFIFDRGNKQNISAAARFKLGLQTKYI